ncbi:MAG: Sua5/YciO/YrdC/YwlC family protein [Anaerolineae bacterium]
MTDILPAASPKAMKLARRLLREGEVIAFPGDEGYCLGANAFERFAVRQLYTLTERPAGQGLLIFIYQADDLSHVAQRVPNEAWPMLHHFWPTDRAAAQKFGSLGRGERRSQHGSGRSPIIR